jgi:hypothetical protein
MSYLVNYINSLPDTSFAAVQKHFTVRNVVVKEEGPRYLLLPNQSKEQIYAHETPEFQQAIEQAVGTILTKDTNTICCFGFPKTTEVSSAEASTALAAAGPYLVSKYVPGTLIRAYWTQSGWRISTTAVMNAYDSYWGSEKSFGDMVAESLGGKHFAQATELLSELREHCSYQFILQPGVLHHIGTYDNINLKYVSQVLTNYPPIMTVTCDTLEDIRALLALNAHGVIFYPQAAEASQAPRYKMLTSTFSAHRALLGNTPDMYLRFIECWTEGTTAQLMQTHPQFVPIGAAVMNGLNQAVVSLHEAYMKRYVKKEVTMLGVNYYYRPFISQLHSQYHLNKKYEKTTYDTVYKHLLSSHPKVILFLLKGAQLLG